MDYSDIIRRLKSLYNKRNIDGMARFGINPKNTLGVSVTTLRAIAKGIRKDSDADRHALALKLWKSKIHEARILASIIDLPGKVSEKQMDSWAKDFDSWDICDGCCMNLFDKTGFAVKKTIEWSKSKKEFVKRASFAMIAAMASHRKDLPDKDFIVFLKMIIKASTDERNFVRKAVNWALRGIGKRSIMLNRAALMAAKEMLKEHPDSKAARWIANDAIRELESDAVQKRLRSR